MTKKTAAALIASVLGIVVGIILVFVGHGNAAIAATNNTPAHAVLSLNGHWKQTKSGIPGAVMTADIFNGTIRIDIDMNNSVSGLYWAGSFDTGGDNLSPFSVTSVGDTNAMSQAMFGSQDSNKVFYYNNGVLSFPFSMMGVSTTVELSRSSHMNIGAIMSRARKVTADNAPAILTGLGVTGLVTTAILTGQATFKTAEVLTRRHHELVDNEFEPLPFMEKAKIVGPDIWKYYVPALGTASLAITCIIAANRIQTRRAAALASAYTLSQEFFKEYRGKVLEKLGDKQEKEISEAVAQDRANKAPFVSKQVMIVDGQSLCFDTYTGRYFTSSVAAIREAVNEINFQINSSYFASLSDFYFMIGLDAVKESDDLGWNADRQLAVTYSGILGPNNQPAIALTFDVYPIRDYHRVH